MNITLNPVLDGPPTRSLTQLAARHGRARDIDARWLLAEYHQHAPERHNTIELRRDLAAASLTTGTPLPELRQAYEIAMGSAHVHLGAIEALANLNNQRCEHCSKAPRLYAHKGGQYTFVCAGCYHQRQYRLTGGVDYRWLFDLDILVERGLED